MRKKYPSRKLISQVRIGLCIILAISGTLSLAKLNSSSLAPQTPQNPAAPAPSPAAATPAAASAAQSAAPGAMKVCREVAIGNVALDSEALATTLGKAGSDVTVTALGKRTLMLCGPPANVDVIRRAVEHLSGLMPESQTYETHSVRLFFFRRASELATVINNSGGLSTPVKSLGDDLLIFTSESNSDNEAIRKLKKWVAMIDVPRPEVSLLAWSAQISSSDSEAVRDKSNEIRGVVSDFNEKLQEALERGSDYLQIQARDPKFFAPTLGDYLSKRYFSLKLGEQQKVTPPEMACQFDQYCLGFTQLFAPVQPSLSRMLLTLIGSQPADTVKRFVTRMEDRGEKYPDCDGGRCSCEENDKNWIEHSGGNPGFSCFADQLDTSLRPGDHLAQIRVALADFLYQYKSAQFYPEDFTPWNQAASAQALDSRLNPIIVAFNRDLTIYLRSLQEKITTKRSQNKKVSLASDGIITARVVSGNLAKVDTTTQSFFQSPPTLNVRDLFAALPDSTTGLSPIMAGHAADLLAAGMKAEQRTTAKVGRDFSLQITANTLQGASACEMDVTLNSGEGEKPSLLNTTSNSSSDENLSRVAKHNITTKVRVDSQKLFEISSFTAALVHGKSVPLIPPFVDLPYIGNLARLRLPPGTVYHQSFAIVSAVIVPTAADLANIIEFRADLESSHLGKVLLDKPEVQKDDGKGQTLFYWIVTHFQKGGDSLSGPFLVKDAPKSIDENHTVSFKWSKARGAQSYDVLRSSTGNKADLVNNCVVVIRHEKTDFTDKTANKDLVKCYAPEASKLPLVSLIGKPIISNSAPPATAQTSYYYWIVTHYREGDSLSGPFRVTGSFDDKHPVTLSWQAPDKAQSFDVLRTVNGKKYVVERGIKDTVFTDEKLNSELTEYTALEPAKVYRRITRLMSNLNVFHRLKLDCIANEAGDPRAFCKSPLLLSNTESDGP